MAQGKKYGVVAWIVAVLVLGLAGGIWYLRNHPDLAHDLGLGWLAPRASDPEISETDQYRCALTFERTSEREIEYELECTFHQPTVLREVEVRTQRRARETRRERAARTAIPRQARRPPPEDVLDSDAPLSEDATEMSEGETWTASGTLKAKKGGAYNPELVVTGRLSYPDEELEDVGEEIDRQRADEAGDFYKYNLLITKEVY